jgi:ribose/xylose/arabinose/galactoside ABC-type transport system permease subunit
VSFPDSIRARPAEATQTGSTPPGSGGGRGAPGPKNIADAVSRWSGRRWFERYATILGFLVMVAIFWALKPEVFGTWDNAKSILDQAAVVIILAVGLTIVMTAGEFDLAFPGLVGLCAVVAVKTMADWGGGPVLAVILAMAVGIGAGAIGGALVATKRTSSFITTLALNGIWGGVALGISGGAGGSTIVDVPESYASIASERIFGIALPIFYALAIAGIAAVVLRYTVFGRNARALGENEDAARLAGIRLPATRIGAFAVMGACTATVAIIMSSKLAQYTPDIASGLFIPPFVAAFFGISVLALGRFNVFGTVIGALFIGTLETGLLVAGAQSWIGDAIVGAALIVILFLSAHSRDSK